MWFMFGIVTVVTFIGYYSYQNYISNWTGEYSTFKGNDYSYKLIKRNRRYFNDLKIGVGGVDTFTFRLKEEKWYDRVFKKIGISIEQEVGESEFDKRIYIVSDDPVFLSYLNKNKEIKTELLQLFQTLHHRD